MNKTLVLSLLLLVSCGKHHKDPRTNHSTNAEFRSYINVFESNYGRHIGDIPIYFADAKDNIAAQCLKWTTGEKAIEVDQVEWSWLSEEQRQQLIDHELGHCELNLEHNDKYKRDITGYYLCPSSIMNPNVFSDYAIDNCYVPDHAYYMRELFKR
jgi:hypothetical protein